MGMRINTYVASLNAQRSLGQNKLVLEGAFAKLASGSRINKAADDAAGLSISENLRGQIRGLTQASRNAQDGISLVQVAEGGLSEVSNMIIRMRELGVQGASDTIGDTERTFLDMEFQNLKNEIQRITETTRFNGTQLLDGTGETLEVQVGIQNNEFQDRIALATGENNTQLSTLGIDSDSVATKDGARESLARLDTALTHVNTVRSNYGALQNRLQSTMNNLEVFHENISAANSRIRDADMAHETAELTRGSVMQQAATAVLAQANSSTGLALKLIG